MPAGKPIVTTVIRAFNRRDRISDTIRSALAQTLEGQPIIVVDDASTDGTADVVQETFGDRVQVIRHAENKGAGGAANTGLNAARTPYTAFLDSDDFWYPEYLETMLDAFRENPGTTLVYSDLRRSFSALDIDRPASCQEPNAIPENLAGPAVTMSLVVMRTRTARDAGGFSETQRIGEDFDFYIRLWMNAPDTFVHVKKCLVEYDNWAGGITKDTDVFLQHVFYHVDKFLREPAFAHLADKKSHILSRRSFGIAANREVDKWLSNPPTRSFCVVIGGVDDETALVRTLSSIAAQRLPAREVIVLHKISLTAPELLTPEWPFLLQCFPQAVNDTKARILRNALALTSSSLVLLLDPGDVLTPTALDDHRYAFSCSFRTIAFSYGGIPERPIPPALPLGVAQVAKTAMIENAPGLLSAMAMSRKTLLKAGGVPDVPDDALWYALVCQLSATGKPGVRIKHPVLDHRIAGFSSSQAKLAALKTFAETENGRRCKGILDELQDITDYA
ncbi:glycosyltransferase family 2 protein [Hwanghaeella sp.]|uniref:glycosyltransferase family 2 protein n=1 Tax=Hwanghaeella sp. TaxID=2605943 RepID=UPI003CCBC973